MTQQMIKKQESFTEERLRLMYESKSYWEERAKAAEENLEIARRDIQILIANLRAHEINTGEYLDDEDAAVVKQIEFQYIS